VIHKAVQDIYLLDPSNRRLSNLYLPKKLDRYLSKWVGKGVYSAIFDNVEDSLSLSRLQCFDFQGVNNQQYADLIEPLMVWLLRRIKRRSLQPCQSRRPQAHPHRRGWPRIPGAVNSYRASSGGTPFAYLVQSGIADPKQLQSSLQLT
jgi:hypothetical protein